MPVQFETKITQIDSDIQSGIIETIHWRIEAVDGERSTSIYGTCTDSADTLPRYDIVTEQEVIDLVEDVVKFNQLKGRMTSNIKRQKTPTKRKDLPWRARQQQ